MTDDIPAAVKTIIHEEIGADVNVLSYDKMLETLAGWDSITMSCIMVAIEQRFKFEFTGDDLDNLTDLQSLIGLVRERTSPSP